jgi:hypothetical protein
VLHLPEPLAVVQFARDGGWCEFLVMLTKPSVSPHPDGYQADWHGFPRARALFSVEGSRIVVSDIFRDPNQPKGCAGQMLADCFVEVRAARPANIRLCNILEKQPTALAIRQGIAPQHTILGRTLLQLVQALGGRISQWRHGSERDKPWIEVDVVY